MEAAITIAGSEAKLGALAGYSQNAIWYAKRNGRVSAELALSIDKVTKGVISKSQLRPDLYPPEPPVAEVSP
jgi:DNA-binding transcriptional regulator YdaS (Cro superfamily)